MKRITTLILIALALLSVSNDAKAQSYVYIPSYTSRLSYSVEAGLNLSKIGQPSSGGRMKPGYFVGAKIDYQVFELQAFYLESGVKFTTKGLKKKLLDQPGTPKIDIEAMYIQVPLHAMYSFRFRNDASMVMRIGPYIAYGVGGKTKFMTKDGNGEDYEEKMDTFGKNGMLNKKLDYGLSVGVSLELDKVYLSLLLEEGFATLTDVGDNKSRNIAIGLGYNF